MREIKFRAWDVIDKEMFRVVMLVAPQGNDYLIVSGRGGSTTTRKDNCILMQFTGLKDKNGKEIYEGDVVKDGSTYKVIEWGSSRGNHVVGYWTGLTILDYPTKETEVVGNLYENPELLTV